MNKLKKIFAPVTTKQCIEFGLVAIMVTALLALYFKRFDVMIFVVLLSAFALILPRFFYPFAVVWFALAEILGAISSRVILTIVFCLVVVPIGIIRKVFGKDDMKLKRFKKDHSSVMKTREHIYEAGDLLHTF